MARRVRDVAVGTRLAGKDEVARVPRGEWVGVAAGGRTDS